MSQEAMADNFLIPSGKCQVERGSDVAIVARSKMVAHSLEAADALAKEGVKAEVVNLRNIRPLDLDTIIKSVKKTNRYVGTFSLHIAINLTRIDWLLLRAASPHLALVVKSVPRLWKVRHLTISMRQSRGSLVLTSPRL